MFNHQLFSIRESRHRVHNPITESQLAGLGASLNLPAGTRMLDLACGSGEMLTTWARDYQVTGIGVDINHDFIVSAQTRALELGVDEAVEFIESDASGYLAEERVDVAACVGATWIGGGVPGTIELLRRSVKPGGILLIGEPYWRVVPATPEEITGCGVSAAEDYLTLSGLLASFSEQGFDVVEMVTATQASWDSYMAPQWLNMRRWADAHPSHELHEEIRQILATEPQQYAEFMRNYFGWGVFALMAR